MPRGRGLSIALWLFIGFTAVIAAFVTGSLVAKRGTQAATAELGRVRAEVQPLTRTARELGESSAGFDRAVLAYLGSATPDNRAALTDAGTRLSAAVNGAPGLAAPRGRILDPELGPDIARHQALGFELARAEDQRRAAQAGLESVYRDLAARLASGGSVGIRVGESVITRPALQELATALDAARADALHLADSGAAEPRKETAGERNFQATLQKHAAELQKSPGAAWLSLVQEDFASAVQLRRAADGDLGRAVDVVQQAIEQSEHGAASGERRTKGFRTRRAGPGSPGSTGRRVPWR